MSKRKWYTRAIYSIVALAMTVGLLMVPAVGAAEPEDEEAGVTYPTFWLCDQVPAPGKACWDNTDKKFDTWSIKLSHDASPADSVYFEFVPNPGITLDDLSAIGAAPEWSWWQKGQSGDPGAQMELRFTSCYNDDPDGAGHVDVTLYGSAFNGTGDWVQELVTAASTEALYYGNRADGTAFSWEGGSGGTGATTTLGGAEAAIEANTVLGAESALTWELTRVRMEQYAAVDTDTYVDNIKIDGTTYTVERGPEYWMDPDIAYNVKTATECFTLMGPCGPVAIGAGADQGTISWSIEKGCGTGAVTVVSGGTSSDNYVCVRLNTKGDAHICAVYTPYLGDPVEVCAEKKWGEIYCTELTKGALVDDQCCVTEYVEASFLWDDCETELELPADDAKVDWWLMDIDALAAVQALEAALGDDPCDDDGGCGGYEPDFFSYDVDGSGTIEADEVFDSPRDAMLEIYDEFDALAAPNAIAPDTSDADATHEQTSTGVDGKSSVNVTLAAPTSAILVTLTDYPIDKHGQNTVCVQHETWIVVPPPVIEKLPNILWAGEKDVIEWRLDVSDWNEDAQAVVFYLEDPSVGTFEALEYFPYVAPYPGFAYRDQAFGLVEYEACGDYYAARVVFHSDKQGKANVVAQYLEAGVAAQDAKGTVSGWEIVSQQGFLVYCLAFEDAELVNLDEDVDNDEAWEEAGETTGVLDVGDEGLLRLRVKGFFEDPVMKSTRLEKPQDLDGDGTTDIILPAGRWVLPDDYPTLAIGKLMWDLMDTPTDDIVSWLDEDGDKVETLGLSDELLLLSLPAAGPKDEVGGYGEDACYESPLYDATLTSAQRWADYLAGVVSFGPVIGPFSKLEPVNDDGTSWAAYDDSTQIQPEVPADGNEIDDFTPEEWWYCRTTVVPDGLITPEDANMPPAEVLFVLTEGAGDLTDVDKGGLYYRDAECVFGTSSVDGEVYTNPYYWQEIPANLLIPPMYGSGLAGYEWDSWDIDLDSPDIDGPYRFWDELDVWTSDEQMAMDILDLSTVPPVVKVYTDNRGEAWVKFEQQSFDGSVIQAIATFPYLIGDHLPLVSNPVIKMSENEKDVKVAVEAVDDIRDLLYVFVRNYDGTPATCEEVEWAVDGPHGTIEELYEGAEGTSCYNACLDLTCIRDIAGDSRSALGCTRLMTAGEITDFTGAYIDATRLISDTGTLLFDPAADEDPADYAIAGIKVLSSLGEDVDILIKVHDCWEGVEEIIVDDQVLLFGEPELDNPAVEDGLDHCLDVVVMVYNFDNATKTWSWYNPDWPASENTIDTLYKNKVYWIKASDDCTLLYGNQSYDLTTGWNNIPWLGY